MSPYLPSVRGDALLVTHGRFGAVEDLLLISAAVVLDGVLGGHLEVTRSRRVGVDRRQVGPGAAVPGAPALMADLRERASAVAGDTPWGWFERAAVFAPGRVVEELIAAGVAAPAPPTALQRMFRHATLRVEPQAEAAARERLGDVLTGRPAAPQAIALAGALRGCGLLEEVAGLRLARRQLRAIADAGRTLDPGPRALLDALDQRRRRASAIAA